ncbi:unnamed protein product [Rhizoctonia solani]|uniref:NAD-P-binding protein n=1 Tax=Rhizoctonia solani TaxID=456999 RepID=A0A8H3CJM1_9AGAM|nr:uncharacterized protein RhiXN_03414 [Rhizoctonia solani]KAF8676858.1 NAD-P-binding protein [Rhizoctonia solani]QRW18490.1 hypothetical protein RhiXN_03414 [Rhizoctonia solani]CAE6488474.1 unnamed protein product [Rhizoctonia solani]
MPPIAAPAKILLTGVNGYLGAHVAKELLDHGFAVVGTVRSSAKGDSIAKYFEHYGERFSYSIVQDMTMPGVFDPVISVGEFDGVAHTAAPIPTSSGQQADSSDSAFNAAIAGTLNVMHSIKAYGQTVKRVVFTSSTLAALQSEPGIVHNESHWNDEVVKRLQDREYKATDIERYMASKCLSEKAAWKFIEDNKSEVNFDLVTILPTAIIGPNMKPPLDENMPRAQLDASNMFFKSLKAAIKDSKFTDPCFTIVHVKDTAALHAEAFIHSGAAGHRIPATSSEPSWQDICDALNEEPAFSGVPGGNPGVGKRPDNESLEWDTSYAKSLLGRNMIGARQMVRETAAFYQKKGWEFVAT